MKTINFSDKQFESIRDLIDKDISDLTEDPRFLGDLELNPKEYIDEMISLAAIFNLDFWKVSNINCSSYSYEKLKALYNGISERDFIESYEQPSEEELVAKMFKGILKGKDLNKEK